MADLPGAMGTRGLDVGLVCDDGDAMRRFYGEVLGFRELFEFPVEPGRRLVMFDYGTSNLKLQLLDTPPAKQRGGIDEFCGYRLLTIVVDSIDDVSARAQAMGRKAIPALSPAELGLPPTGDPAQAEMRLAFTHDPDGNLLELVDRAGAARLMAVGATVRDADAARAFWVDVVGGDDQGTKPITPELTKRDVDVNGTIVKFWQHETPPPLLTGPITDHVGVRYLTATVPDAAATFAALVADGARPVTEPAELLPGITIGFVEDPDGNLLELVQG